MLLLDLFAQACYNAVLPLIVLLLLNSIRRSSYTSLWRFTLLSGLGGFFAVFFALLFSQMIGGRVSCNLAIHGLAWYGSFFLFASAFLMYRQKGKNDKPRRIFPTLVLLFGFIYCGVAANTLLYEPTALVIKETTITTPKISSPMTIVFCSDMQADRIGSYERWTLQKIKEQNADLILFGGDYFQTRSVQETQKILKDWNQLFREIDLQAPLGVYAVQGNMELWQHWETMFTGTAIIPQAATVTEDIDEIRVTFLSLTDSSMKHSIPDENQTGKFRIIVGHRPIYAMAEQEADLLLAGHTHGGQVQIPFWGPIVTLSKDLPRNWASGKTVMPNGVTLIVSHGSGLERGRAPRVRFWCRPDFWVIRLLPVE